MGFFELAIALYIGVIIYVANLADVYNLTALATKSTYSVTPPYQTIVRRMLYGLVSMLILFGFYASSVLVLELPTSTFEELGISPSAASPGTAILISLLILTVGVTSFSIIMSSPLRQRLSRLFGKHSPYNSESLVHLVAVVLSVCLIGYLLTNFIISGGLTGVAQTIQDDGLNIGTLVFQGLMFVIVAFLGIGLAIRRTFPEALQRLGLTPPTPKNILAGVFGGVGLIILSLVMTMIWIRLVSPEQYAQQSAAAAAIEKQFNTVQAAFILSLTAAASEEILFRGALQPIFGIPLTTIFFVLFHNQYTLTPAMLIILCVGTGLALLRRYQGTLSAIIAHFVYNFVPVLLIILLPSLARLLGFT